MLDGPSGESLGETVTVGPKVRIPRLWAGVNSRRDQEMDHG